MGIADGITMGKNQIETVKCQLELEQKKIAELVTLDLNEQGLPCKVINDGMQTMRAGIIPVRIERLKIIPTRTFNGAEKERFEMEKSRLSVEYGKQRQEVYKEEMNKLKQKEKQERATKQ